MAHPDDDESPKPSAVMDPSGRVVRTGLQPPAPARTPAPASEPDPMPSPVVHGLSGDLELADRPARPEDPAFDPFPKYREDSIAPRRMRWPFVAAALLVAAGAAVVLFPELRYRVLPRPPAAFLYIESEPPGAEIRIGGTVVGQTPFASENAYTGTVPIELRQEGYKPWRGTFQGGAEAKIEARLKK